MKKTIASLLLASSLMVASSAFASEGVELRQEHWQHKGFLGTFDKAAVQRGYQVYKEVCSACHSMKFMAYRNLSELGYTEDQVKAEASHVTVTDGPNDDGEMFERPARPSDHFKSPFKNDKAARAANGGALPPDLSLLIKARPGEEDYVFSLLLGYDEAPQGEEMLPGQNWNHYFPGNKLAMPKPLSDNQVTYTDGTPATLEQEARDVTQFLAWAGDPYADARKQMGVKVLVFLLIFAVIMYNAKRKIWRGVH